MPRTVTDASRLPNRSRKARLRVSWIYPLSSFALVY